MNVTKTFLVSAIGLVLTLVIIGIGVGVYRSVKPIADSATEGVNTLAGEMTNKYYKYNGKVMTGKQIKDDTVLVSGGAYTITTTTGSVAYGSLVDTESYTLTLVWNSSTNTPQSLTITKLNQ